MKTFMDEDFLLQSQAAKTLFHNYAKKLPIIDYHCHINPAEIAADKKYKTITEVWLGGDHYKWRLMRSNGTDETCVTGSASDFDKFYAFAGSLQRAVGHPLYHWSHLELQRYFGITEPLTAQNAKEIFDRCNEVLARPDMSVRGIIKQSNVKVICTTDDPADTLEYHEAIAADKDFDVKVLPATRPDKALNVEKPDFPQYIDRLSKAVGYAIPDLETLKKALSDRLAYFKDHGATVSDHALVSCVYLPISDEQAQEVFAAALAGKTITPEQEEGYKTNLLLYLGREYYRNGFVMQLHFGCKRDNNTRMYERLGPDTGYDAIYQNTRLDKLSDFLNALERDGCLPKTILYSLNPQDNEGIVSLIGCFQSESAGKIQHGSAWWFNDTKAGMEAQLTALAQGGILGNFVGMLTDSRSFLSYTRHEYFRRILCNFIGNLVENGEYPNDMEYLGKLVEDICYYNAARYFGFGC